VRAKNFRLKACVCGVLAAASVGAAYAQDKVTVLEEIVVTAQKRQESLQEVPIAITAYTSESRDLVGIKTIEDVAAFTPGMNFSSLDRMSVRGIGRLTNGLGSDPGVATYSDGFYTASLSEVGKSPMFVERIEVLRGPQGTLYGRNSIGGAVNIIAKRPSKDGLHGELRVSGGSYAATGIEAAFDGPISDAIRFRIAGNSARQREGYFDNTVGKDRYEIDRTMIETQLEVDLSESVNWWIKYQTARWTDNNSDGSLNDVAIDPYAVTTNPFPTGSLVPRAEYFTTAGFNGGTAVTRASVADHYKMNENRPSDYTLKDNHIIATNLTFEFDSMSLKYIGGYQQYDFVLHRDYDGTPLTGPYTGATFFGFAPSLVPIYPDYTTTYGDKMQYYSNELNLQSSTDNFKWIFGLYQFHEHRSNPVSLAAPNQLEIAALNTWLTAGGRFFYSNGELVSDSKAAFGQIDWGFSDSWNLTVGLRYSQDEKEGFEENRLVLFLPVSTALIPTATGTTARILTADSAATRRIEDEWSAIGGKVGIEWNISDDINLYANYNRGYKSGGFNLGTLITTPTVDEETVDAFEVGAKALFFSNLQINTSLFMYKYKDAQVPFAAFRNGVTATDFKNVDADSMGAEVEVVYAPIDNLQLLLNYSYLNAEITRQCSYTSAIVNSDCYYNNSDIAAVQPGSQPVGVDGAGNQLQNLDGNKMPQSPENKNAFNASYTLDFSVGKLTASGTYTWQDEATYSIFADPRFVAPSFARTDFRILWNDSDDRYTVIGYVRNAFDEEGYNAAAVGSQTFGAGRTLNLQAPRTIGGEIQVRF
jgi:iron complex outermembrane receptor protein